MMGSMVDTHFVQLELLNKFWGIGVMATGHKNES